MPLISSSTRPGAHGPIVIPARPDQLPKGVPAAGGPSIESNPSDFGADRRLTKGAKAVPSAGGKAHKGTTALARKFGLAGPLPEDHPFVPYRRAAAAWKKATCRLAAQTYGAGVCGPMPSSIIATAAWQNAISRYFFELGALGFAPGTENNPSQQWRLNAEMILVASRLGNDSRQNCLAAYEICAREALTRGSVNQQWFEDDGRPLLPSAPKRGTARPDKAAAVEATESFDDYVQSPAEPLDDLEQP